MQFLLYGIYIYLIIEHLYKIIPQFAIKLLSIIIIWVNNKKNFIINI